MRAVAVDLGATSGRVVLGEISEGHLALRELARFANGGVRIADNLYWDILGLYRGVLDGLRQAGEIASIGIDSWAVDFGLLDEAGRLVENPLHYRDERFAPIAREVLDEVAPQELYARNGIQFQPFNTLFQLVSAAREHRLERAATMLMIPDLLGFFLTGERHGELTNASTTQLLGIDQAWDLALIERLRLPASLLPEIVLPGTRVGELRPRVRVDLGLERSVAVTSVASHDTASAVVAVPAAEPNFAYISAGTWSLVGLELESPVLSEESRLANFTNERGLAGTVRFLRNVTGFYLLEECLRTWNGHGERGLVDQLVAQASQEPGMRSVVDVDDPALQGPRGVVEEVAEACRRSGEPVPGSRPALVRCLLDSLAAAYALSIGQAARLAQRRVEVIHLVGGGARNALLAQLTADACGVPVLAGPVEAATIGNLLVQGVALGILPSERADLRRLVRTELPPTVYAPRSSKAPAWKDALGRLAELSGRRGR